MDINKVLGALQTIQQIRNPQSIPSFVGMDTAYGGRRNVDLSDFYETEEVPEGFQVEGGKLVDTSAPIGIPRVIAGIGDAVSGLIGFRTDFDKRKKTGDAYHNMAWNPETKFNLAAYNSALNNANMMDPMLGSAVPSPLSQAAATSYLNNNFSNLQNLNQMAYNQALNQSLNTYDQYMPRNIGYATTGRNIAELMPSAQSNLKSAAQNRMGTAATSEANLRNSMANLALAAAAMANTGGARKFG